MSGARKLLWEPSEELLASCTMTRFARWVRERSFSDYEELWEWSVEDLERFWRAVWTFFRVEADAVPERVLGSRAMPGTEWFPGVELSYAEHVFRGKADSDVAVQFASERGGLAQWTWAELRRETASIREGLRGLGVGRGDRVVAYLPNVPQTVAAFLAVSSLGAVWSSCSPDFGARSVIDRFAQIEPKVLLATDSYDYGGRTFDKSDVVEQLKAELGVEHTVLLSDWFAVTDAALEFERVPFDHPLWVLYSSGTTGLPKAIVQGHGGILLEHLKKMHLHLNAQEGDRVFWFTTTGWMMWNFLVGVLLTPASIVLYDGNPCVSVCRPSVGPRRGDGDDGLRDRRRLHPRVHEGGRAAGGGARPVRASCRGLDGVAALAGGVRVGVPGARAGVAVLDVRGDGRVHRLRRRYAVEAGVGGGAAGPRAGL